MAVHSSDWIELHELLKESVGEQTAGKLMDFLPPVGWAEVATKDDLRALEGRLLGEISGVRGEISGVRGEMESLEGRLLGEISGVRGEMESLEGRLLGKMESLEGRLLGKFGELRGEFGELRGEFGEFREQLSRRDASLVKWVAGAVVTGIGVSAGIAVAVASAMS